ncbi:MAG: hypothetical protein GQ570_12180 [Helicobacteraceae bacterium]|nr:hypothetical protein [Helicobacteraceae bacterium]
MNQHKKIVSQNGAYRKVVVSQTKANIRNAIERKNDTLDLIADISNALNDFLNGLTDSENIQKFKSRQADYRNIIVDEISK